MKNILFYFYLLSFLVLLGAGFFELFGEENSFGFVILWQLVWGPISILHCIYKVLVNYNKNTRVSSLYNISLGLTVFYFALLALLSSSGIHIDMITEDILFVVGIVLIPWSMLGFFTYILWKEKQESVSQIV